MYINCSHDLNKPTYYFYVQIRFPQVAYGQSVALYTEFLFITEMLCVDDIFTSQLVTCITELAMTSTVIIN